MRMFGSVYHIFSCGLKKDFFFPFVSHFLRQWKKGSAVPRLIFCMCPCPHITCVCLCLCVFVISPLQEEEEPVLQESPSEQSDQNSRESCDKAPAAERAFIFPHTRSHPPHLPSMPTLPEEEEDSPEDLDSSSSSPSTVSVRGLSCPVQKDCVTVFISDQIKQDPLIIHYTTERFSLGATQQHDEYKTWRATDRILLLIYRQQWVKQSAVPWEHCLPL